MPRQRSWTDDDLRRAVAEARQWKDIGPLMGLDESFGSQSATRRRIQELGLDVEHLPAGRPFPRERVGGGRTWTDEELVQAVAKSTSYAGVLRELGLLPGGGTYVTIRKHVVRLGLDVSHFTGQAWSAGRKLPGGWRAKPLNEILVRNSTYTNTYRLKQRLIRAGLKKARCEVCGIQEWNGIAAPLQLDHINGDRRDHRLENLRILCPNCHAQTDTWCSKNVGSYDAINGVATEVTPSAPP